MKNYRYIGILHSDTEMEKCLTFKNIILSNRLFKSVYYDSIKYFNEKLVKL